MSDQINSKAVILFDGVCNLCNGAVKLILKNDPEKKFRFGSLQGNAGKALTTKFQLNDLDLSTFVLIQNGTAYIRSTAALKVAKEMRGWWPILYGFMIVPRPIRDAVYALVAKYRYRWFGRKSSCMIPGEDVKDRFID